MHNSAFFFKLRHLQSRNLSVQLPGRGGGCRPGGGREDEDSGAGDDVAAEGLQGRLPRLGVQPPPRERHSQAEPAPHRPTLQEMTN